MPKLKLEATTPSEERVLEYLTANASDILAEKINEGTKTLTDAMHYCQEQARSEAVKGVACIEDAKVYGWCVHYFEDVATAAPTAPESSQFDDEDDDGDTEPEANQPSTKRQSTQAELDLFGTDDEGGDE